MRLRMLQSRGNYFFNFLAKIFKFYNLRHFRHLDLRQRLFFITGIKKITGICFSEHLKHQFFSLEKTAHTFYSFAPAACHDFLSRYTSGMRPTKIFAVLSRFACLATVCASTAFSQDVAGQKDLLKWRAEHATELLKPAGWLSLTGLEWFKSGDNSFGSAPDNSIRLSPNSPAHLGVLRLQGNTVELLAPESGFPEGFLVAGAPVKPQLIPVEADSDRNAPHLTIGTLNMYVIRRADRVALRVKDSKAPALVNFHGLNWYEPDSKFRVTAKWIPYAPPKSITLDTLAGTKYDQPVPGAAEFTLLGKTYRLEPVLEDPAAHQLFFIVKDTTSVSTTYHACRFLYTVLPDHGLDQPGTLVLDFNRLENPPCAYTPYSTCPLPPPGNRMAIPLPVGEKRYHE